MRAEPGEERHAVHAIEAHLSRAHAVQQLLPAAPVVPGDHHLREAAQRARDAGAKRGAVGVSRKRPSAVSANTPTLASARSTRWSASGCAPTRFASAAGVSGPFASSSATPSCAATNTSCETQYPEMQPEHHVLRRRAPIGGLHGPPLIQVAFHRHSAASAPCATRTAGAARARSRRSPTTARSARCRAGAARPRARSRARTRRSARSISPTRCSLRRSTTSAKKARRCSGSCSRTPRRITRSAVATSCARPRPRRPTGSSRSCPARTTLASTSAWRTTGHSGGAASGSSASAR